MSLLSRLPDVRGSLKADVPLAPYTWLRVGGAAEGGSADRHDTVPYRFTQQGHPRPPDQSNPNSGGERSVSFARRRTFVMAAVSVVLPWSTWPIVPTLQ